MVDSFNPQDFLNDKLEFGNQTQLFAIRKLRNQKQKKQQKERQVKKKGRIDVIDDQLLLPFKEKNQ